MEKQSERMPLDTKSGPVVRFAVPKKGRLYERITKLLVGSGFHYIRQARLDIAYCTNFPVQLVFLPAKDIATFVGQGDIDLGITGQDIVAESDEDVEEILQLNFGKCKLCIQTPVSSQIKSSSELIGKRIATSFPNLTAKFFASLEKKSVLEMSTRIKYISGSVEAGCSLGVADGIVDLVESGTTMKAAGLELIESILDTQVVLIGNKRLQDSHKTLIAVIKKRLEGYMTANRYKIVQYNVKEDCLEQAKKITPGKRSPTVSQIDEEGWMSVSAMVENTEVPRVMDELLEIGATDILTLQLDNYRS